MNLRELDEAIARELGHTVTETDECNGEDNLWIGDDEELPLYSSDWSAMGELIEEMGQRGFGVAVSHTPADCLVRVCSLKDPFDKVVNSLEKTAPEAVSRACLTALTSERGEK